MEKENINIVKKVCKELGVTQKELAKQMDIHEETVSKWSRGIIDTPKWALKHFELLKIEKQYNIIKEFFIQNQ
jgi:DNA-binding XRE family transcriptional regulator